MKKGAWFVAALIALFFFAGGLSAETLGTGESAGKVRHTIKPPDTAVTTSALSEEPPGVSIPLESAQNYVGSGADPAHFCSRLDMNDSLEYEVRIGAEGTCSLYILYAGASSAEEESLCAIARSPNDTSKIAVAPWEPVFDVQAYNVVRVEIADSEPSSLLELIVCGNGDYSLVGPTGVNQAPPCDICPPSAPVPTVGRWGMLLLALLLTGTALWFIRRNHRHRA